MPKIRRNSYEYTARKWITPDTGIIEAVLDKTCQTLKMDITTGDFVTPREIEYSFKRMFKDRTVRIMAYNLETVLAEEFETVITRGIANTRMSNFYKTYVLTTKNLQESPGIAGVAVADKFCEGGD